MPLTYPTITKGPQSAEFRLIANSQAFTNPLGQTEQIIARPGARWAARISYPELLAADRRLLSAFLSELDGIAGTFYFGDPLGATPAGVGTGTPLVDGPNQTGNMLVVDGWTASTAGILKAGDYFHYDTAQGRELKICVADLNTDANGRGTLLFRPNIRNSPPDNTPIVITSATATMRLLDDEQARWSLFGAAMAHFTIDMIETFS